MPLNTSQCWFCQECLLWVHTATSYSSLHCWLRGHYFSCHSEGCAHSFPSRACLHYTFYFFFLTTYSSELSIGHICSLLPIYHKLSLLRLFLKITYNYAIIYFIFLLKNTGLYFSLCLTLYLIRKFTRHLLFRQYANLMAYTASGDIW